MSESDPLQAITSGSYRAVKIVRLNTEMRQKNHRSAHHQLTLFINCSSSAK
jgi:hypothetical protein